MIIERNNTMKDTMKIYRNRIIAILTILLITVGTMRAQVFIMDEDAGGNIRVGESEFVVPVPYQGTDLDEYLYAPLGSGWLLLAGFGGYYLLKKRKEEDN